MRWLVFEKGWLVRDVSVSYCTVNVMVRVGFCNVTKVICAGSTCDPGLPLLRYLDLALTSKWSEGSVEMVRFYR